jgi:ATP-dependent helicase YprA (DUF1998 family)
VTVLDPLRACERISLSYQRYLTSTFAPRRADLRQAFDAALGTEIRLTKGPFLQASPPFAQGASIDDLVAEGVLAPEFRRINADSFPTARKLHLHQEQAIRQSVTSDRNLVVATGTGSGKTECFVIPIINHLLREEAAGTLANHGVRALLLYPMNALANDQVKRLRRILVDLPAITFGRYVGETTRREALADDEFRSRYPSEPRLANELISRERMQQTPPHILLTNYAMLEYLLLRPEDSPLFDGASGEHWKFVVLDEAHVYNGAQGTEVAMLLRRVKDRVLHSERGRLRCFATSATLGQGPKDHPALVQFAADLFDEPFACNAVGPGPHDVVTATHLPLVQADAAHELPQTTYQPLQRAFRSGGPAPSLHDLVRGDCPGAPTPSRGEAPAAYLARLLRADKHVVAVQEILEQGSAELHLIANQLFTGASAPEDLVSLIDLCVASRLRPDDTPLIPARYHFFLRSLAGAFCCLHPGHDARTPSLLLAPHISCPSCARRGITAAMFELGVCRACRAEYLVGQIRDIDGEATMAPVPELRALDYLLLGEPIDADDEDGAATGVSDGSKPAAGQLCPGCGRLGDDGPPLCDCPDRPTPVRVWRIRPAADSPVLRSCAACSARTAGEVVSRFLTGTDAPVAVIATDLYQALPPSDDRRAADRIGEGRKLLTFSDSRQDAAFFAPYLENTYGRAVRRRIIAEAIRDLSRRDRPRTEDIVFAARKAAEDALVLDPDGGALQNTGEVGAWLAEELLALDRRQSLEGTGMADIAVALPRRYQAPRPLLDLGFDEAEATYVLQLLLETVRAAGAITMPDGVDVRDERFAPRNFDFGLREQGSERGVISWLPVSSLNRRLDLLAKIFARKNISADPRTVLGGVWRHLTDRDGSWTDVLVSSSDPKRGALWRLSWKRFEFSLLSEDHSPSRCSTCQRLWWRSVAGVCPSWRCPGTVTPIEDPDALMANHYASLYRQLDPVGMSVQEHTAQLTSPRASSLQDDFTNGKVNVLSCSTTFELGVDVGEIQTVLLRNVPPSSANYVQRAGRAGRRTDAAALVVTFAQRRNHDLTHFDNPRAMVDGFISPPAILLDNPSIVRRHTHSVAFAAFERRCAAEEHSVHRTVGDFFSAGDGGDSADHEFVAWVQTHPAVVGDALLRVVPPGAADRVGLHDWSWVDALVRSAPDEPSFGWLGRAGDDARDQLGTLRTLIDEAAAAENFGLAKRYQYLSRTLAERQLLGFLATRNVLPKYGFPVDVVELDLGTSGDTDAATLDLSRDLALAISEYSPGSQVVAAKVLWMSTGLGVRTGHVWPTYRWAICGDCGAFRQHLAELPPCAVCGSEKLAVGKTGTFVIPLFGFVGKRHAKPGESRPPRQSSTETYFGNYRDTPPDLEPVAELGGDVVVETRTSRQGRITIVNRGPAGRGYRLCEWCGYGEAAPVSGRAGKGPAAHTDIRRPGRQCQGRLVHRQLGHEYLTDVTEIRLGLTIDEPAALSTLYAVLEGVTALTIARDDVNGTLYRYARELAPALVVFDAVPGGAGHARRIAEHIPQVLYAALARVETCECGAETSCYNCLRNYRNQIHHDLLSRGAAAEVLRRVLGQEATRPGGSRGARELDLAHESVRPLVRAAIEGGAPVPVAGFELGAGDWQVEVAWPDQCVAVLIDTVPERDAWLTREQWDARLLADWTTDELLTTLRTSRPG